MCFHRILKQLAVFGQFDGLHIGPDELYAVSLQDALLLQLHRQVQRGLCAHRGQQRIRLFDLNNLLNNLGRQRLNIGRIGKLRVGHNRSRVAIHQNNAKAFAP